MSQSHAPSEGFFDHLPEDVQASPLFNSDLAPVPRERRNWSAYNFAALWISMAHCIPTYMLAGGLIAVGMNWWQALLTIALGNIMVLVPILLNSHPGAKYGIPFPVLARASFGVKGANVPAILRAIVACGWFGIQTYIGGQAIDEFLRTMWPGWGSVGSGLTGLMKGMWIFEGLTFPVLICFLIFWVVNICIIYRGMNAVRIFENWAAPLVLVMAAGLLWWAVDKANGLGPILHQPSHFSHFGEFFKVFVPSLTAMVGYWATLSLNIPDFTRFSRSQRDQMVGQVAGLPTTMTVFSAMGVLVTSSVQVIFGKILWDPVKVLGYLTSPVAPEGMSAPMIADGTTRMVVAIVALLSVAIATISVNIAANVVSPANDFSNLAPQYISFKTGGLLTGILGILILPWKLLSSPQVFIFDWLVGYSGLLGPIAGVMVADYWVSRRRQLDINDLYRLEGRYTYRRGLNPSALAALVIGIAATLFGLLVPSLRWLFDYAWFAGTLLSFGAYLLLTRLPRAEPRA